MDKCTHFYENGKGAVEIFGYTLRNLKSKAITSVVTDKDNRGYCLLCGELTTANIPLEECEWYKTALEEYSSEYNQ